MFNIANISDKLEAMTDFIPLGKFNSENVKTGESTLFLNKNKINGFSYTIVDQKECLSLNFDSRKFGLYLEDDEFTICKEDNPVAFNELFKRMPEKLPKYNITKS